MKSISISKQKIPVKYTSSVVVLGGGPAGIAAAVSAARRGIDTTLIERYGYLGGQATGGLVILLCGLTDGRKRIIGGFCQGVIDSLHDLKACDLEDDDVIVDPETLKWLFDQYVLKYHIRPLYHSLVVDAVVKNRSITHVIVDGKSGRYAVNGKFFIDATGDADTAKWLNLPHKLLEKDKLLPLTLSFRMGNVKIEEAKRYFKSNKATLSSLFPKERELEILPYAWIRTLSPSEAWFDVLFLHNKNCTDIEDLTSAELKGRDVIQQLVTIYKTLPGFKGAYLIDTAPQIGCRESRRILGEYYLEKKDISSSFPDEIVKVYNKFGTAGDTVSIPYRCLVPQNIDNLLMAGRCISVHHEMLDLVREIPCCMATGKAAGLAASLALKNKCRARDIDGTFLSRLLSH